MLATSRRSSGYAWIARYDGTAKQGLRAKLLRGLVEVGQAQWTCGSENGGTQVCISK